MRVPYHLGFLLEGFLVTVASLCLVCSVYVWFTLPTVLITGNLIVCVCVYRYEYGFAFVCVLMWTHLIYLNTHFTHNPTLLSIHLTLARVVTAPRRICEFWGPAVEAPPHCFQSTGYPTRILNSLRTFCHSNLQ